MLRKKGANSGSEFNQASEKARFAKEEGSIRPITAAVLAITGLHIVSLSQS